ncbi:MAG: GNAT family N-acetyltransferase [Thiobacillus sp.]
MQIRKATHADLNEVCILADQIALLHNAKAPDVFAPPAGIDRDREFWATCVSPPEGMMWVALSSGSIAGFITAKLTNTHAISFLQPRTICKIGTIVVASQYKRRGVGRALMVSVEKWARQEGADEIRLEVFDFNLQAAAFYQALDFVPQSHILAKSI